MFSLNFFRKLTILCLLLAAISSLLALRVPAQTSVVSLRHTAPQVWNSSSGLPQDTVRQFLETRDGFLWMATEGGLVRFDSYDFTVFDRHNSPAFGSDLINALFEDTGGSLWIATSAGLVERNGKVFQRVSTVDGAPSSPVWAIAQDRAGRIWAATTAGLADLHQGKLELHPEAGTFDGHLSRPLVTVPDGTLWAVSTSAVTRIDPDGRRRSIALPTPAVDVAAGIDGSLWLATPENLLHVDASLTVTSFKPPSAPLLSLACDHDGILWMGTSAGIYATHSSSGPAAQWKHFGKPEGLIGNRISKLYAGQDGSLSVVSEAGLAVYEHGHFSPVFEQDGFRGNEVIALYQDRAGDLWTGSETSGAAILRRAPFATLTSRDGLRADLVRSLFAGSGGDLWFGTAAGLSHLEQDAFSTFTTKEGLASDEILALAHAGENDGLWIGTPDGLNYLERGHVKMLTASDGLPDDNIRSLLSARDQALWIGTSHGLARLPQADPGKAESIQTYTTADGLGSNVIGSLIEDADGSLWIGTLNGLSHLTGDRMRTYSAHDGLATATVTALGKAGGVLWVGTAGGGLFALQDGKISQVGRIADYSEGRLPTTTYAILSDDADHLWLSSSTGIYRVAVSDLQSVAAGRKSLEQTAIEHFDVADGLRLQDCASGGHPEAALTPQGMLWFATQKGALVIDTHEPSLDRPPPPISLENVSVDDVLLDMKDTGVLHIPAGHARLAFHYAGISLAAPSKVRYRYQLEHFDRGWIDASVRRTAYYTNISPGKYTFRVLASTDGGHWSETAAEVEFTIAPHYYQTWWFYTLLVLLAALIAWQLYLYRLRQIELRFDAVLGERSRIAREIHDTLAQDIVGISVQLELVSRLMAISVEKAKSQLHETRALVRKSLDQARASIWELRSSTSGDLPTRLRDAAKELTRDSGITLQLAIGGTYRAFHRKVEDELLRIAQEAMTNAVRHASPHTISVSLNYHASGARLEVQDDGKGFVVAGKSGPAGHYGIRGMYERAERAHATLEIQSRPGSGTTVIAEAPELIGAE